ncbi:MAG: cell division protein FtsA [Proteobacteria bacterium]|nr:cell division protein FtsA [Pseudomonadota bacterium]NDC24946.1 cell division protein FtsA [Pseudomonadota bacterium]NDD04829.1 cell division protein FtsA [Pseudomonadota bacterium]NDG27519.1 cell division protein FtsA [Pseudomonadota bacterium]
MKAPKQAEPIVGIDFGTTKICVVIAKPTPEGLEIIGVGKQPSHGIRKGVVVNIPATVEALKKAVEIAELMAGCSFRSAVCGIAGTHIKGFNSSGVVAIRNKEVTVTDVERAVDAARAVAIPLDREVIHVIPQEFTVDDQEGVHDPIGMNGVRLESKVHIVTGAVSSAQNIIKCANLAGIQVSDIVLEPLASAEACLTLDEKELGVVLVDIGGGTTDVALFSKGAVVHSGVVSMGGSHITNDVAVGLRCSIQDAENIKIHSGCAMSSLLPSDEVIEVPLLGGRKSREVSRSVLTKIIEPRVEEILTLVGQEIANSGYKHLMSAGVVLTGGPSLMEGMPELAEFTFELPVRRGSPQGIGGLVDVVSSPMYSTAVGLLTYGMKNQSGIQFRQTESTVYDKVVNRMKSWLGEVF